MERPIYKIAEEIQADWKKVSPYAVPYLQAMNTLENITDHYMYDDVIAKDIILRFLCNAGTWKGETARRIKAELNALVK